MADKVQIEFEADTKDAQKDIEELGGALEGLSSTAMKENLMDLKKSAVGLFSDMKDSVGDLMKVAGEDELVMMRLEQQLANVGDSAAVGKDDILEMADNLSKLSGFDDEALVEGQTTLLRFGGLTEEQFGKATKAAADLAAMTGMSLPSAFQQVAIALDNPENGMGRLGRQVGELTDAQQEAIDKMLEMGDKAGAQGIILDILAGKVNGAADAYGETFVGKVGIAETKVGNLKSLVGDLINQNLPQWLVDVGVGAKESGSLLGPTVDSLADLAIVLSTISKSGGVAAIIASIGAAIKTAFGGAAALIGGISLPVLALVVAIGLLIATIIKFGKDAWEALLRISGMFEDFKTMVLGKVLTLVAVMPKHGGAVGKALVDGIKEGIKNAWNALVSSIDVELDNLLAHIKAKLGISSPSKQGIWLGQMFTAGIAEGMKLNTPKLALATESTVSSMLPSIPTSYSGRGGTVINVNVSPTISTASPAEFERIVPYIDQAMRRVGRRR